jgi:murein DD-endopeptidase MepM/ murein hydrolase activator NlpD
MVDGTYYCPVAYYRELLHKEHPNYTRDIGVSSEAGAWGQRRKNAAKDWQTSSSLLANQGWYDPNKAAQEMFGVPVSQWTYSQYIDWKGKTGKKIGYIHKGVDIAVEAGVDVYAALDGTVRGWHYAPLAGLFIEIDHNGPAIGQTRYLHLQEIDTARIKPGAKVKGGQCIAVSGRSGQVYMGAHLHFETWTKPKGSPGTKLLDPLHKTSIPWQNGTASKAARYNPPAKSQEKIDKINTQSVQNDLTSGSTSILKLSIDEFEKDLLRGQAQSLLRAYPTFKLYFIEDDSGDERKRLQFDDFFSYNAVQSIRVIRSRKIAADLCEIVLTNVSGVLSNRKYRHDEWDEAYGPTADKGRDATGRVIKETSAAMEADTKKENPMASFLLQEGTNISLRMGYSSDPDRLETVFNGVVMEVDISESDDLIRIVAQSYAVELVQDIKGLEEAETTTSRSFFGWDVWGFWSGASTGCILENMISQPEVLHFGRWYHGQGSTANRELLTNKWHIRDLPQDDNIFAPSKSVDELKQMGNGLVFKDLKYTIYQTTIWDIFKEMELRHPNFIAAPVPYKDTTGERMTMFFGLPNQLYFARAPTGQEQSSQEILKRALENKKDAAIEATSRYLQSKQASTVGGFQHTADERGFKNSRDAEALVSNSFREARLELAKKAGYIRPFRSYHLITAGQHIISNNIKATSRDIYNTIAIKYSTNGGHGVKGKDGAIKTIAGTGDAMFTLKLDSALPTEETRTLVSTQLNVSNEELAKRYALALLSQSLKETYQGDITIIGNPKMKPTDICLDGSTLISVEGGVKPIKEIKIGDFVYTHRGRLRRVCQLFQNRSSGSILQIKCKTDPDPLIITANHPILSLLREEVYDDDRPWIGRKLSGYSPLFRRADSLKKMDYICIPRIKSQESLDFALARLIGLYLAEGSIVWENRKTINRGRYLNKKQPKDLPYNCHVPVAVQWSFNSIKEAYMLEEINSLLAQLGFSKKATGVTDSRSNGWSIIFYDRDFSDLIISLAGYNTQSFKEGKFLKNFYDTETSKFILGGYFDGDGSQTTTIRIGQLCSGGTSLNLGHCIHQLLINVGIPPSSSIYRPMEKNSFGSDNPVYVNNICKFYSNLLIPYCKYIKIEGLRAKTNQTSLIDEDFSYIPISSLEKIEYDQPVYNIGVEEDNSYLAANKAVHNCYVFDDYNDMIGPIEIEQVTHVFDQDQGFRTEIKPNMLVHASEFSILHSCEAMGVVMEGVVRKWWGHRFLAPVANVIGQGFGLFGGFLATKVLNYTQLSCPMIMTPMMHHGRIFAGGIPTRKLPLSVWRTIMGDWSPANDASYADWKQSVYDDVSSALGTAFMQHTVGDFWKNGPNLITNENTLSAK